MAKLKAFVASLDEVPENLRELYVEQEDGRFKIDADDVEDVKGLKSALEKERKEAKSLRAQAEKFKGVDPEKYAELTAQAEAAERKTLENKGQYDAIVTQLKAKHTEELDKAKADQKALFGEIERRAIEVDAVQAIQKLKGRPNAPKLMLPHIKAQARVRQVDGKFVTEVLGEDGQPRIADGTGAPMTVEQLVAEMRKSDDFSGLFEGDGKSGGGAPQTKTGPGAAGAAAYTLTGDDRRNPAKYAAAKAAAEKAGLSAPIIAEE